MHRFLLFVLLLAACHHPSDAGPVSFAPTLSAHELWSGGTATITDAYFAVAEPVLELGSDTVPTSRIDDSTYLLMLPRASGTFPMRVIAGEQAMPLGDVTLHGFDNVRTGPFMSGQPYWLPGGAPRVFAGANHGAAIIDLRTLTPLYSVADSISTPDCIFTPSPTHRSDRFVMMGKPTTGTGCGPAILWTLTEPPVALDSIVCCATNWYTSGQPSPGRWIFNWNNHNNFYVCESSCVVRFFNTSDGPNGVTISPRADRFLWLPADRPVIYDAHTLDTAYVLTGFMRLQGAFSLEGDTLAVVASEDSYPTYRNKHILAVRAANGEVLRDVRVDTLYPGDSALIEGPVAFDPVHPWLYATMFTRPVGDSVWHPSIIVLDRANWTVLGVLETPEPFAYLYHGAALVPDPPDHRVYLVNTVTSYSVHDTPGVIFQYSTPP